MAYDGWISFAGQEIVNRARLNAYVGAFMPHVLRRCECPCDDLPTALGHHGYSTPFGDLAPWVDEDDPDSADFYGVMVNSMRGIDDSVRKIRYSDSIRDGGAQLGEREGVREVRFVMTAFAGSEAGMEAGWRWLKSALQGSCGEGARVGADLCFFSSCPPVGRPVGPQVVTRILGNNLVPQNGRWDGRVFTPDPDTAPMTGIGSGEFYLPTGLTEGPEGHYHASGLTEGPEGHYDPEPLEYGDLGYYDVDGLIEGPDGYFYGWEEAEPGYLWSGSARLSTPWLSRPIACGEAFWEFEMSGEGTVTVEAVVDGTVVSTVDVDLAEDPQAVRVTEAGVSNENSKSYAQVVAHHGDVVLVHAVREIRHENPEPGDDCSDDYLRTLHDVFVTSGPIARTEREVDGGIVREFEFIAAAMTPWVYGASREVATMYRGWTKSMRGADIRPWSGPLGSCNPVEDDWLLDPDCPPLAPLPSVPSIPVGCGGIEPHEWQAAYLVDIPETLLKEWVDSVPVLSFRSDREVRGVRARFFPRPDPSWSLSDLDPCSACGTFEISYIPENTTMTIDGTTRRIVAELPGGKVRPASHLVSSGENDAAFTWPELSCGIGYFLLIETTDAGVDGMSLRLATKE